MNKSNNNSLWLRMIWMLALVAGIHTAAAQDDYNPTDPPEPQVTYRIAVSLTPDGAGSVSGIGKYAEGTSVYINTSGRRGFVFKHWLKDGVEHTTERGFYYTVERANVSFVAVYDYEPSLPAEPEELLKCPLWLECSPAGACSFNQTSGTK